MRALLDTELNELNQSVLVLSSMVDKAIGDAVDALGAGAALGHVVELLDRAYQADDSAPTS